MQQDGNDCASKLRARTMIRSQDRRYKQCTQGSGEAWCCELPQRKPREGQTVGQVLEWAIYLLIAVGAGMEKGHRGDTRSLGGAEGWEGLWERKYLTGRSAWLIPRRKTSWARPRAAVRLRRMPCWLERRARRRVRKRKVIIRAAKVTPRATYVKVFSGKISPF